VVFFTRNFPKLKACQSQLVRSAPAYAADYRAGCRAKLSLDFMNKLKIIEEEFGKIMFWIEFAVALEINQK
jgi:four helix bundle protein